MPTILFGLLKEKRNSVNEAESQAGASAPRFADAMLAAARILSIAMIGSWLLSPQFHSRGGERSRKKREG